MSKDANLVKLQNVRTLVLDDEAAARDAVRTVLEHAGAVVKTACDGREGLNILLREDFDVLVVDLHMEGMNGTAFVQEARKIWPWLGVVVVTGFPGDLPKQVAADLSITRVLAKPFVPDALRETVLAEAQECEQRARRSFGSSVEQVQKQLGLLRRLGETAIEGHDLWGALREFCSGLGRLLPCAVIGMLGLEKLQNSLILIVREATSQEFLDVLEQEMKHRFEVLSGRDLSTVKLNRQVEGLQLSPEGPHTPESTFVVPIIISGELCGLMALAATREDAFSTTDISFLYHAANQFSTVLVALDRMRELAIRDPLTAVYNRRRMEEELEQAWNMAQRYEHDMSVAVIDIDHFKQINDTHGHPVGDRILCEFAEALKEVIRTADIMGRYGGDEFVVALVQSGLHAAKAFGQRLLETLRDRTFCADTLKLKMTASVGIAALHSRKPPATARELLEQADYALMDAKRNGRDRCCVWAENGQPADAATDVDLAGRAAAAVAEDRQERVLVVDDDPVICTLLETLLQSEGFHVESRLTVAEALSMVDEHPSGFDVVLTDLGFDNESGFELLQQLRDRENAPVSIVMTGQATVSNAVESLRHGAYDFIEKPLVRDQLLAVLGRGLLYRRLLRENTRYKLFLEDMVREKSAALRQSLEQTRISNEFTLEAFVEMLDAREHGTAEHSLRVRALAHRLGAELRLAPDELENLRRGAQLHDIGKMAIPDAILLKEGPLTEEEWTVMKQHPETGYTIISANPAFERAAEIVRAHHEHFDGSGYPRGLTGENICLGARIFAVIDSYDTIRSERVYKSHGSAAAAREEIRSRAGTQFDPVVVDVFVRCADVLEKIGNWSGAEEEPASGGVDLDALRTSIARDPDPK
jgi:diguanylate cyclase (GGDEF)-like protein/putative nucleotidyltransferase with HDIG domain